MQTRPKKLLISIFVLVCLWIQIGRNVDFALGSETGRWLKKNVHYGWTDPAWEVLEGGSRFSRFFGQAAGLLTYWRMFTPTITKKWQVKYYALYTDDSEQLLALPNQTYRNFWQRNFIDFREGKLQSVIFYWPNGGFLYDLYAQHLCRTGRKDKDIEAIKITYEIWPLYPPSQAKARGQYMSTESIKGTIGAFLCAP